jgi:hypothetical protein
MYLLEVTPSTYRRRQAEKKRRGLRDGSSLIEQLLVEALDRPAPPAAPRQGEGDGSATTAQKQMIRTCAKAARIPLPEILVLCGLSSLRDAGWRDAAVMLGVFERAAQQGAR